MEKRVFFRSPWLPYVLVAPQLAITVIFFFWPGGPGAVVRVPAPGRLRVECRVRRAGQFPRPVQRQRLPGIVPGHGACFRCWWRWAASSLALLLAVMADRVINGALAYNTLLIWPYAVAPAVAAVLWVFLFAPSIGIVTLRAARLGIDWNYLLNGGQAMTLVVIAAVWKQISYNFLFFLAGLQSIPQIADRGGGDRRRRAAPALLDDRVPAAVADHVLPAGRQHRLRLLRHLRRDRRHDAGRPGRGRRRSWSTRCYEDGVKAARPGRLVGAVGDPDGDRHQAHRDPVPLRRKRVKY